jgi:hypothetical protein
LKPKPSLHWSPKKKKNKSLRFFVFPFPTAIYLGNNSIPGNQVIVRNEAFNIKGFLAGNPNRYPHFKNPIGRSFVVLYSFELSDAHPRIEPFHPGP